MESREPLFKKLPPAYIQIALQNTEIRHKILVYLYNKYYEEGFSRPLTTEDVVKEVGIPTNLANLAYTNIIYLRDKGQIYGEMVLGTRHPKWIRIEPYGIDVVENTENNPAELHYDIRFKIISKLYEHNFEEHDEETLLVDANFAKGIVLDESKINLVFGDVNYLYNKGMIEGHKQWGIPYPYRIKINVYGIDTFEGIINRSLEAISTSNVDTNLKAQAVEIIKESDSISRLHKFREFIVRNRELLEFGFNIFKSAIGSPG